MTDLMHIIVLQDQCFSCGEKAKLVYVEPDVHAFYCLPCAMMKLDEDDVRTALEIATTKGRA